MHELIEASKKPAQSDEGCECAPIGVSRECGSTLGICTTGEQECEEGYWGLCDGTPPEAESCNGEDDNCDGVIDEDLLNACGTCGPPPPEACDGADNDCDGSIDEDCPCAEGQGNLVCGSPLGICTMGIQTCMGGQWSECSGQPKQSETCNQLDDDCDGDIDEGLLNACGTCGVVPAELCDGQDNDCDGSFDEECECPANATRECGLTLGECTAGLQTCIGGYWSLCSGDAPEAEVCDTLDNDCDGTIDDALLNACGLCGAVPAELCTDTMDNNCSGIVNEGCVCTPGDTYSCNSGLPGICGEGVSLCGANMQWGPCQITLSGAEDCGATGAGNGIDENCSGEADEGCVCEIGTILPCQTGEEGLCRYGAQECLPNGVGSAWSSCIQIIFETTEVCGNGLDEDCDGQISNNCTCAPGSTEVCDTGKPGLCGEGLQTCQSDGNGYGTCVQQNAKVVEACGNAEDDDCDGGTDEGCLCTPGAVVASCDTSAPGICRPGVMRCAPDGESLTGVCEPTGMIAAESCGTTGAGNGVDENCSGQADEGCVCEIGTTEACYAPKEGVCMIGMQTCVANGAGSKWGLCLQSVTESTEVCGNGLDEDCDGMISNNCTCAPASTEVCDTGKPGVCASGIHTCQSDGNGYGTCVQQNANMVEVCGNAEDDDCDGRTDEGCLCTPGTVLAACRIPGAAGICATGVMLCAPNGEELTGVCEPTVAALPESCGANGLGNGLDEDCNGETDEICACNLGTAKQCLTGLEGVCRTGIQICESVGASSEWGPCLPSPSPTAEVCGNGLDEDCDGQISNNCTCTAGSTVSCYTGMFGLCASGTATCNPDGAGYGACVPGTFGPPEVAENTLDDNCDGRIDEVLPCTPGSPLNCNTGMEGVCAQGTTTCLADGNGYGPCAPTTFGSPEGTTANGLDDDCDGTVF